MQKNKTELIAENAALSNEVQNEKNRANYMEKCYEGAVKIAEEAKERHLLFMEELILFNQSKKIITTTRNGTVQETWEKPRSPTGPRPGNDARSIISRDY